MNDDFCKDPIHQFKVWYDEAVTRKVADVDSMVLATASKLGRPSARIVLYKGLEKNGFVFFTNYCSRKGIELQENSEAALLFYWSALGRQVRIEGSVETLSPQQSDRYWKSRPRDSQLSGFVSEQSGVIPSFASLVEAVQQARERFRGQDIPRPLHWGGYRVAPKTVEFWIAQENRLHRRIRYQSSVLGSDGWMIDLLSP